MNFDYCFMKRVSRAFIFVLFMVSACSSVPPAGSSHAAEPPPGLDGSGQNDGVAEELDVSDLAPTDPDVMYHVMAAEMLGAEGDIAGASAEYLEAALASDDPEIAQRAAKVAVSAGEWQMVAMASDRWAMLEPGSLEAHELAAGSRLREGDYAGAEYQLARILELTESDRKTGWGIVTALLAPANDKVRANKVFKNLLVDFEASSDADALYARSQFAARAGSLDKASEFIDEAIEQEPGRADLLAWSGRLALTRQNTELALQRYGQAWQAAPGDPAIAMAYAELLKREKDPLAAQAVLAELPDTPEMRFARVMFALEVDDRQSAETLYQGFSDTEYENTSNAAFQAAQSAELLDLNREAVDWYKQVTGERSLRAIMRQAFFFFFFGDVDDARSLLAQLRIQSDSKVQSQSYQAEARILQDAGQNDEAMQVLNKALVNHPQDVALRYMRGLLAVAMGQLELAEGDFRHIISIEPENAAAINALGYTLADLTDRYAEAESLILQAYELQPNDSSIIDSMGWIAYRLGRLPDAELYLRQAWRTTRAAEIAAHLGEVLWVSGQKNKARGIWQSGMKLDSSNEVLINTLRRFGELP